LKLSGLAPPGSLVTVAASTVRTGTAAAASAASRAGQVAGQAGQAAAQAAGQAGQAAAQAAGQAIRGTSQCAGQAGQAARLAAAQAGQAARLAAAQAGQAARQAARLAAGQARQAELAAGLLRQAPARAAVVAAAAADVGRSRARRRVWAHRGRAYVEIRGLPGHGAGHRRLARDVTAALTALRGVHRAELNAATSQVLIGFDEDAVDVTALVSAVEAAERKHGTHTATFPWPGPAHPAGRGEAAVAAVALAADVAGMASAITARVLRLAPLPHAIRVPLVLAEAQPRLREAIAGRAGPPGADLLLALGNAVTHGLTQGYAPLALDAVHRLAQLTELRARERVWAQRERALHETGHPLPSERAAQRPRPVPLPPGPVERAADRTSLAALAGAASVLGWTGDPGQAAELLLATVPKAARLGREGFACVLGTQLARLGVVPLDGSALRRLDRISAVVIDSEVLCAARARILPPPSEDGGHRGNGHRGNGHRGNGHRGNGHRGNGHRGNGQAPATGARQGGAAGAGHGAAGAGHGAAGAGQVTDPAAWQAAQRLLAGRPLHDLAGPGPWAGGGWELRRVHGDISGPGGLLLDLSHRGRPRGRLLAGLEPDPLADALLGAARDGGARVVLTGHASTAELAPWADEVLPPGRSLARQVRRLQAAGHGVMVISATAHRALAEADAGVAVITPGHAVSWSADLICGPGLGHAWRVVRAAGEARLASQRSAKLSLGGSALGALLVAAGNGNRGAAARTTPVHSAALLAFGAGMLSARSVARLPEPPAAPRGDWHAMTAEAAFARLAAGGPASPGTAPAGADRAAVSSLAPAHGARARGHRPQRQRAGGPPALSPLLAVPMLAAPALAGPARAAAELASAVRKELTDPLTPVLALGAMASAVVGSGVDAALVGGVMTGNALISGVQRMRAERSLRQLLAGEQPRARLVRWPPGQPPGLAELARAPQQRVLAVTLRPGDVIGLRPFDVVPADARLLAADGLEVDESALTGESLPVSKSAGATPGAPLTERSCMVYEGATVLAGTGVAVVVATGDATEAGRAAAAAGREPPATGIQARLAELARVSVPASVLGGLAVSVLGLLRGVGLREAVASGVAVAVAAVPEGLPLVATVAQLAAARRLSRTGLLVRSARALEALGRVDVVCFDKTGTLTEGRLRVALVATADGPAAPGGPDARHVLRVAARACPPARAGRHPLFHSTDRAVVDAASQYPDPGWRLTSELPFEATRGYAASLGTSGDGTCLAVKGAPEVVLPRCTRVARGHATVALSPARRRQARAVLHDLAGRGLRVLAVAERPLPGPPSRYRLPASGNAASTRNGLAPRRGGPSPDSLASELVLAGFVAIADTPRAAAAETVRRLCEAGVRVTMVTGDHPDTATAIAREVGIPHPGRVLTWAQISRLPEREQVRQIASATVFARVSPEQKVRIVQALQRAGHVVAMAGDGVNDAAAIRLADAGIGVHSRGSRPARGAADLVLAGGDTLPVIDALLEGRALWARVRDAVSILVGGNAGEVAFILAGTVLTGRSPLSARQLLLVNMLTDMLPALAVALAGTGRSRGARPRRPAGPAAPLLGRELARSLMLRGGATALGATVAWHAGRLTGRKARAGTMALATLVLTQLGQTLLTSGRSPLVLVTSAASAGALAVIVATPGVSQFFGCTPLGPAAWAIVTVSAAGATVAAALAPRFMPALAAGGPRPAGQHGR
jgi:cation-transporting ATPase I